MLYSVGLEWRTISVQFFESNPLNIPRCFSGSLKQYVSSLSSNFVIDLILLYDPPLLAIIGNCRLYINLLVGIPNSYNAFVSYPLNNSL